MISLSCRSLGLLGSLPPATALTGIPAGLMVKSPSPLTFPYSPIPLIAPPTAMPSTPSPSPATSLAPLVLSPSLPPVPGNLVYKIRSGAFIPLKELLGDNIAFRQRVEEMNGGPASQPWWVSAAHPHMRLIHSPLQWVYAMLMYIAVPTSRPGSWWRTHAWSYIARRLRVVGLRPHLLGPGSILLWSRVECHQPVSDGLGGPQLHIGGHILPLVPGGWPPGNRLCSGSPRPGPAHDQPKPASPLAPTTVR